jgi:hypothetical protein
LSSSFCDYKEKWGRTEEHGQTLSQIKLFGFSNLFTNSHASRAQEVVEDMVASSTWTLSFLVLYYISAFLTVLGISTGQRVDPQNTRRPHIALQGPSGRERTVSWTPDTHNREILQALCENLSTSPRLLETVVLKCISKRHNYSLVYVLT